MSAATGSTVLGTSTYGRFGTVWEEFPNNVAEWGKIRLQFVFADDATLFDTVYHVGVTDSDYRKPCIAMSQQTGIVTGNGADDIITMITYETRNVIGNYTSVMSRLSGELINTPLSLAANSTIQVGAAAGGTLDGHVIYDPNNNNFMITYYDSATQVLVYSLKQLKALLADASIMFKANYGMLLPTSAHLHTHVRISIMLITWLFFHLE